MHIKPKKNSLMIRSCAKMPQRFYGPFKVIERIRLVAYQLAMPSIVKVHDAFHISFLEKYFKYFDHVIEYFLLQVEPEQEFQQESQCILQKNMLMLRNQEIEQVKVQ